jgi:hypothetical protein
VNFHGDDISLLTGRGDGTFRAAVNYPAGDGPRSVVIRDLNGDGLPDLITANWLSDDVSVFLAGSGGAFGVPVSYPAGNGPESVAAEDLNGDGRPDLAVANWMGGTVTLLLGRGDGTFQNAGACEVGVQPRSVAVGDLDGDGARDLVVANRGSNDISVLLGYGDGTFQTAVHYGAGAGPVSAALADLDLDGDPDVAVANFDGDNLTVFINKTIDGDARLVVGPGPAYQNPPVVKVYPPVEDADAVYEFSAYGPQHYGVNVTCGDVDGNDRDDILTGPGPGALFGPHVRGFAVHGQALKGLSFIACGTRKWGVNVAAGDLDRDGTEEIITGAGPGAVFGPHVRAFRYESDPGRVVPLSGVSFMAYGSRHRGVNIAGGDIDGDGFDEIVTGPGPGEAFGAHVRGWDVDGGQVRAIGAVNYFASNFFKYGAVVGCGDLDGDGFEEIVTTLGPGETYYAYVRGWNYDNDFISPLPGCRFVAWYPALVHYGARVFAGADLDQDTRSEMVIGAGPDPSVGPLVRVFRYDGEVSLWFSLGGQAAAWTHGANVAAGRF